MWILLSSHGTFSKIDHFLGGKASINKYKNIEIVSYILSDHSGIQLDIIENETTESIQTHGD
jgi:hypothetical protein